MGMDKWEKGPCVVINCGDEHKPDHKAECCDQCEMLEHGWSFVGFEDIGFITPVSQDVSAQLLVNPANSGKNLLVTERSMSALGSDDNVILFKYYFDPVVQNQGNLGSIVNLNTGSMNASVAQLFTLPTVAPLGTAVDAFTVGVVPFSSTRGIIIAPGHSLLAVYRANAENTRGGAFMYWTECKVHEHHMPMQG